MRKVLKKIETTIASMKFAIVILVLMVVMMTVATFVESIYGAAVAGLLIYKSPLFIIVELLLFLSVLLSLLKRLPFRRVLIGFYLLHSGIILILLGSFVTFYSGIDGQLKLVPNEGGNSTVSLDRTAIYLEKNGVLVDSFRLPSSFFPTSLDFTFGGIELDTYYPFGALDLGWQESQGSDSMDVVFKGQRIVMTTGKAPVEFSPLQNFQGLQLLVIPVQFEKCFLAKKDGGFIITDYEKMECYSTTARKISMDKSKLSNKFFELDGLKFFPTMTPYPMNAEHSFVSNSRIYALDLARVSGGGMLIISANGVLGTDFIFAPHSSVGKNFERLLFKKNVVPSFNPTFSFPKKDQREQFVSISFKGKHYIVNSKAPQELPGNYLIYLAPTMFRLAYSLELNRFEMKMNPGTQMPASFESFITLNDNNKKSSHHIYMNHPLRYRQFLFYQSSYFETQNGYGSILSVNYDPGRMMKYLGSLILVLGASIYYIQRSRGTKNV